MNAPDNQVDRILKALQERAKELNCLYRVDERLGQAGSSLKEALRDIVRLLPSGYQYPESCHARILFEGEHFEAEGFAESPWVQSSDIVVHGKAAGRVEVYYSESKPRQDEGPFLKEERKLIDAIAGRIARHVQSRQASAKGRRPASRKARGGNRRDWWAVIDFLRITDPHLLSRLSRKMVNHLCWNGVEEAQRLLQRLTSSRAQDGFDDNQPTARISLPDLMAMAEEAFHIASAHMEEDEILLKVQKWIKDDKAAFLLDALESPATTIPSLQSALQRFAQVGVEEEDLTRSTQTALRVGLMRRLFTDELEFIGTSKNFVEVADFCDVARRIVSPTDGHGKLGGKSSGLFLAAQIVKRSPEYAELLSSLKTPKTWHVTSDGLLSFIQYNHLEEVYDRKYMEIDQVRREYPHIIQVFKNSSFPPEIVQGLSMALDDFEGLPLIVRSSSLLEDRMGSAFSGKYKSLFLANQGSKKERLAALMDAIAEVYASTFGPDPIEYRAERGLLNVHEEMGIMIQEVVGTRVGDHWLPAFAGVAFSNNEFRWSPRIKREDGLLRLVPGLGTRAVDRVGDDYPVLIAPGQPGLRVNASPEEAVQYAPRKLDAINLKTGAFETIEGAKLFRQAGASYPMINEVVSVFRDGDLKRPMGLDLDFEKDDLVVTFDGLSARTPFVVQMRTLLKLLKSKLRVAVDLEFACNGKDLYLLQCRPQSYAADTAPSAIPVDVPKDRIVFSAKKYVSNGRVPDITHIVYVDPRKYNELESLAELREVGRIVGRLNKLLPRRQFILMGPGRWGSRGDIKLGVSVTYSDINNTAALVEIARKEGHYVPDLSFGTHFFQDLVEASIRYLPLFPDEAGNDFNEEFLTQSRSVLKKLLPDCGRLADTVRVIDVPAATDGLVMRLLLNAEQDAGLALLASPSAGGGGAVEPGRKDSDSGEAPWLWRMRMLERLAAQLDCVRFGVKGLYVFGSTKNATAGPSSDIDLIIHFAGTADQQKELELWLEGWSLSLSEVNFLKTGCVTKGLLEVHYVSDEDIARKTSFAVKIGASTDAAKPILLRKPDA